MHYQHNLFVGHLPLRELKFFVRFRRSAFAQEPIALVSIYPLLLLLSSIEQTMMRDRE